MCRRGYSDMQTSLKDANGNDVVAYFVWLPCIRTDSRDEAVQRASEFKDPRVHNYWDGKRLTGDSWGNSLGLPSFAWDVYFLFSRSAKWQTNVPQPAFWMHQLMGAENKAPFLDQTEFESHLKKLIESKQ